VHLGYRRKLSISQIPQGGLDVRHLRWILLAGLVVTLAGSATVSYAGSGCGSKTQASAEKVCGDKATVSNASAEKASSCAAVCGVSAASADCAKACTGKATAKMASAGSTCTTAKAGQVYSIANYMTGLSEEEQQVTVTVTEHDKGVTLVFAGASPEVAQSVAEKAAGMLNKSSACAVSRTKMAEAGAFTHCSTSAQAFADCNVSVEKTETGATAQILSEEDQVETLHAVFRNLQPKTDTEG
jgi:hypothetical protein